MGRKKTGSKKGCGRKELVQEIYNLLDGHYGDLRWWPGDTPFEVIVGAILAQNTNWSNVAAAINRLKEASMLTPRRLHEAPDARVAELIRPSGYYNLKTRRLKSFLRFLFSEFGGDIGKMFAADTRQLRRRLLAVNGIGEETADSILLYAGGKTVFVVDAYTKRLLARHGLCEEGSCYGDIQAIFTESLPSDRRIYNQCHALIVNAGKDFCRTAPLCERCPLKGLGHV